MPPRHFLRTGDFARADLDALLALARKFKAEPFAHAPLKGKGLALMFFNPSLRTRSSMEVAISQLGGFAVPMEVGKQTWPMEWAEGVVMDGTAVEHVKETAKVLSRYFQAIGLRSFPEGRDWNEDRIDPVLHAFAQ